MPHGSYSCANVFTCYCLLADKVVPKDIACNGFADDHSLRKSFFQQVTRDNIKEWMDSMHLKLSSYKTEYIMFGSQQQLTKINQEPPRAGTDLIKLSDKVKYSCGLLDSTLSFDQHVSSKVQKAMANFIKIKSIYRYISLHPF